jgi:type IV pilus assembly protein PilB
VARLRIGELLVSANILTNAQLEEALRVQSTAKKRLGDVLVSLGYVDETRLTQALSQQLAVPWVSLYHVDFSRQLLNLVPREVAEKYCLVPIFVRRVKQQDTLYVAMDDPTNETALEEVSRHAGLPTKPMIASPSDIRSALRVYYGEAAPVTQPSAEQRVEQPEPAPQRRPPSISKPTVPDVAAARKAALDAVERQKGETKPDTLPPTALESEPPPSGDSPNDEPVIEAREIVPKRRRSTPGMIAVTLLDGTTIHLPARKKGGAPVRAEDDFTARDFVSALRAVSHGADASEILGDNPRWEAMFAALLSVLLRKGLIADWEFIEELRRV